MTVLSGKRLDFLISDEVKDQRIEDLKRILFTVQLSEKRMLRELGEHPRRENRTGNLVHYMHKLTYQEQALLAETITANGKRAVHVGMLPFLNRDQVVEILHEEIFNKYRNSWWDLASTDPEISGWENKVTVTQTLKSKEKLVSRMVKHHLARSR